MAWEVKVTKRDNDSRTDLTTALQALSTELGGQTVTVSGNTFTLPASTFLVTNKLAVGAQMMGLLIHPITYTT
jgi:hypothetical protein